MQTSLRSFWPLTDFACLSRQRVVGAVTRSELLLKSTELLVCVSCLPKMFFFFFFKLVAHGSFISSVTKVFTRGAVLL